MAGFLYFEPRDENLPDEYRKRCGNGITDVHAGPNDRPGALRGGHSYDRDNIAYRIKYFPKEQTWRQIPGSECWIGYYNDDSPKPDDLAKEKKLPGHVVDGWTIPLARDFTNGRACNLPRSMDLNESGDWIRGEVKREYRELWSIAVKWWDYIGQSPGDDPVSVKLFDACELAMSTLSHNYDVGRLELAVLAVMTDEFVGDILDALVDVPSLNEIVKKNKAIEQSSTPDGQQA